jgi:hypothetical protein
VILERTYVACLTILVGVHGEKANKAKIEDEQEPRNDARPGEDDVDDEDEGE